MKAEVILCLPQWGKVPSLSRRMRCSAAYAAGCRAKKKSRKRLFFSVCAEGTARTCSALPCPALPRAADSDADRAEVGRRRISIRQGGLPRKEKEPQAALFRSAPKAQPVAIRRGRRRGSADHSADPPPCRPSQFCPFPAHRHGRQWKALFLRSAQRAERLPRPWKPP